MLPGARRCLRGARAQLHRSIWLLHSDRRNDYGGHAALAHLEFTRNLRSDVNHTAIDEWPAIADNHRRRSALSSLRFDRRDARGKRRRCGAVLSRVFAGKHAPGRRLTRRIVIPTNSCGSI
jgi:hypothetical protein